MCYAAQNAILCKTVKDVHNYTLYTTDYPSNQCAQVIIDIGIKKVVYMSDKFLEDDKKKKMMAPAKELFEHHKIVVEKFQENLQLNLDLTKLDEGKRNADSNQ